MNLNHLTQAFISLPRLSYIKEPWQINRGNCFVFAYLAYIINGGQLFSMEDDICSHAFIKIDGKYYDSEAPEGVIDWKDLPYFKLISKVKKHKIHKHKPVEMDEDWFLDYWEFTAKEIPVLMELIRNILIETKNEKSAA